MEQVFHTFLIICMVILAVCIIACVIRAILGPRISDRIVAINMVGTMTIIIITIMSVLLHEGYLVDVAMLYAMLSFLAVVVLTKVYMGVYTEKHQKKEKETKEEVKNGSH